MGITDRIAGILVSAGSSLKNATRRRSPSIDEQTHDPAGRRRATQHTRSRRRGYYPDSSESDDGSQPTDTSSFSSDDEPGGRTRAEHRGGSTRRARRRARQRAEEREDERVRVFYHSHLTRVSRNNPPHASQRALNSRSRESLHEQDNRQSEEESDQDLPRLLPGANADLPLLTHSAETQIDIDGAGAQVPAESLEQFAWLMLRGIEIRKVSRKSPSTKEPYKRYLYMNPQRTALLSSKVAHAAVNNTSGISTQNFSFTQIRNVVACDSHHSRLILLSCNPAPNRSVRRSEILLQFDVDTPRSRDILVRMLSKLVTHFANISGRSRVPVSVLASEASELVSENAHSLAMSNMKAASKRKPRRSEEESNVAVVLPGVECAVCLSQIEDPVQLPCTHMYCRGCLSSWHDAAIEAQTRPSCPECRGRIPNRFAKILSSKPNHCHHTSASTNRSRVVRAHGS